MPISFPARLRATTLALACATASFASAAAPAEVPSVPTVETRVCLPELRARGVAAGLPAERFDALLADIEPDASVLPLLDAQPEFVTPIWDYLAALVDDERVEDGRRLLAEHADLLAAVAAEYGVEPAYVLAVWGVESDYGRSHRQSRAAQRAARPVVRRAPPTLLSAAS
jgi:glucose-6-phosphate 1-epimerase